jgi:aspartate/methionine/tyrosine aminotransferase
MEFTPFELLAWQDAYGPTVEHSLADSGCRPVGLRDIVGAGPALERFLDTELHYPPVRGTDALRASISRWHAGTADNVLVTVGAAEANAVVVDTLVEPGDHVVTMVPGYRQVRGSALNRGAVVDDFPLDARRGWRPDLDALARVVRPDTKMIAVTNPNNPTGTVLTEEEMDAIVAVADRVGAWIVSDEVHRGTELNTERVTPGFWGRHDRVVCVGSLSKAFGMPGLRLGWLIAPDELVPRLCRRHEYAAVSTGILSMALAEIALEPDTCARLLARYRGFLRESRPVMRRWVDAHDGLLSVTPPQATALAFVRYHLDLPSTDVADALRTRGGVLVGAGAHFGAEHHLRLTYGYEPAYLAITLDRISHVLKDLAG